MALFGLKKSEEEEKKEPQDDIILAMKHAKLAERKKDGQTAEVMYHKALTLVAEHEKTQDMTDEQLLNARIAIYDSMANLYLSQGLFDKAESLYKETMRGQIQKGISEKDNSVIELSLKLAMIYAMQNKNTDAEKGYKFCISSLQQKTEKESEADADTLALMGMCRNSYARFLMVAQRLAEAEEEMKRCVNVGLQAFGPNHPQVAVLLNDVATLESMQKKHDAAAATLDKAIRIAQNSQSPDLAAFYCNQGNIFIHKYDLKQAKRSCKIALRLARDNGDKEVQSKAQACIDRTM